MMLTHARSAAREADGCLTGWGQILVRCRCSLCAALRGSATRTREEIK